MPHLGIPELLIILVIVVVVFGAGKLPQVGGAIGKSIKEFRTATRDEAKQEGEEEAKPVSRRTKAAVVEADEEEVAEEGSQA